MYISQITIYWLYKISLSNLVDNLAEGIHIIKCKDLLSYNKDYSNKIDEELKKQFRNSFKFSNNDITKFILL